MWTPSTRPTNQTTIRSDTDGETITLLDFSNESLIQGMNGGDLNLVGDWTNTGTGTITDNDGATVTVDNAIWLSRYFSAL